MPKVLINSSQGLVQKSGGGFAPFGEVQSVTASADGSGTGAISSSASLVLGESGNNAHKVSLPAIADLEIGHTILIANVDAAQDFVLDTPGAETVNGAATITLGEGTRLMCVKATSSTWLAFVSA